MKATLRKKKIKDDKESLYLDFYPPILHPGTGRPTRREFLKLFIYHRPKNDAERLHNKETKSLAENIRAKRQIAIQNDNYEFLSQDFSKTSFLEYLKEQVNKREKENRNYHAWKSAYLYLYRFCNGNLAFGQVTENLCKDFKTYLLTTHLLKSDKMLSQNAAASYYNVFREAVNQATDEKFIKSNPVTKVKSIPSAESDREFLTMEELQLMSNVECDDNMLKKAALFSALTGLRWSDIKELKWEDVQHASQMGHFLKFRIEKTNRPETLPISEQARELMGDGGLADEKVFPGLKYGNNTTTHLIRWAMKAGITKHLTFHCFRHTHATLQLTYGTDIYTVSKLLGHKKVETTQIYAKVIDKKKREAADVIPRLYLI